MTKILRTACLISFWMISCAAFGQTKRPATNETKGTCSNIFNDNHGTIKITCTGFSQKQIEQITMLLKGISQTQAKDQDVLLQKLEEVLVAVKAVQTPNPNKKVTSYKCNGWAVISGPSGSGMLNFASDPTLTKEFQMMADLGAQLKWTELLAACKRELVDHPDWLTSNLLCADASNNLGRYDEGRQFLNTFDTRKGDAYQDAPCPFWEQEIKREMEVRGRN